MGFRAVREGIWMIASNACSGLIPLLPGFWVGSAGSGFCYMGNLGEENHCRRIGACGVG